MTARPAGALALLMVLAGCKAAPAIIGVVGGGIAGGASANPVVGFTVGVALDVGSDYALKYYERARKQAEQDAIAAVAGGLPVGGKAGWEIRHTLPYGNEHGELQVVRLIVNPLAECREVAFSVEDGQGEKLRRAWYTADLCRQADTWKWASAEPAVERWGYLQ